MPTANPTGQMLGDWQMRLVVSAVRIQFEPSSLSSAASLRDGLQRRVALGVNDATNAASSVRGEREADSILE